MRKRDFVRVAILAAGFGMSFWVWPYGITEQCMSEISGRDFLRAFFAIDFAVVAVIVAAAL